MTLPYKEIAGGLRAGSFNVTFPFARLRVDRDELQLTAPGIGTIRLRPDQIVELKRYKSFLSGGYLVYHKVKEFPVPIVFWGNPNKIDKMMDEVGFRPTGSGEIDYSQETGLRVVRLVFLMLILVIVVIGILVTFMHQ
jgi:hypothetical protein